MRNKNLIQLFFIAISSVLSGGCSKEIITEPQPESSISIVDNITQIRNHFESSSQVLCQIKLGCFTNTHSHEEDSLSHAGQSSNIMPDWSQTRIWDAYKCIYVEVPLKGNGIYRSSVLNFDKHQKVYPVRSFLVLIKDKATNNINYQIVTTIIDYQKKDNITEEDFQYVGNSNFNGIILFSRVDGISGRAIHIRNSKPHLIRIGAPTTLIRTSTLKNNESPNYVLSLTPFEANVLNGPSITKSSGYSSEIIYCALCGMPYNLDKGTCSNGCEVEIPGHMTRCYLCLKYYNSSIYDSCPNLCWGNWCENCDNDPCICEGLCESCKAPSCPGPWFCNNCGGEQCITCEGYRTVTRSRSNCPPCLCMTEPDAEIIDKIILNSSFDYDPRAKCILDRLLKMNGGAFKSIIQKFDGDFPVSHLRFVLSYGLASYINASTLPPSGYIIEIQLNGNNLQRPNLSIARTLIHEVIHAEMFRKLLEIANNNGEIDPTNLRLCLENSNYTGMFDYYERYGQNKFQHEQIAQHYIETIVSILKLFNNSYPEHIYESLAWEGLMWTTAWNNLNTREQERITNDIETFDNQGKESCY